MTRLLWTLDDFLDNYGDVEWLIEGLIPARSVGMLYGESGIGKTFVVLHLCLNLASGFDPFGKPIDARTVVYVAAEGGYGLKTRIQAWILHGQHECPSRFILAPQSIDLFDEEAIVELIDELTSAKCQPDLIVMDTFDRCFSGNESNGDVKAVFQVAEQLREAFGSTLLLVHHTGHDKSRHRGAYALLANSDFVFQLKDGVLKNEKQKEADEAKDIYYNLERVGNSLVAVPTRDGSKRKLDLSDTSDMKPTAEDHMLQCLSQHFPDGATFTEWWACCSSGKHGTFSRSTFQRKLNELMRFGEVSEDANNRYFTS